MGGLEREEPGLTQPGLSQPHDIPPPRHAPTLGAVCLELAPDTHGGSDRHVMSPWARQGREPALGIEETNPLCRCPPRLVPQLCRQEAPWGNNTYPGAGMHSRKDWMPGRAPPPPSPKKSSQSALSPSASQHLHISHRTCQTLASAPAHGSVVSLVSSSRDCKAANSPQASCLWARGAASLEQPQHPPPSPPQPSESQRESPF